MPRMTITAIAAAVGVHKSTVSRQARAAGLVGADGQVELAEYQALRSTALDPGLQTSGPAAPARRILPDPDAPILAEERAGKLAADRQLAELELARRRGELLDREEVRREEEAIARELRQRILAVPREVAEDLARLPDAQSIRAHLTMHLETALGGAHDALRGAA
jgi:DNA-binding MurR/RpiR family transcriptional regulator